MKRFILFLLLLPSLGLAADTANALRLQQRNADNTKFVERNPVGVEDGLLGFNSSLEPVVLSLSDDLVVTGGVLGLASTAVTPGAYGSATYSARITVDAKGRITAVEEVEIEGGGSGDVTGSSLTSGDIITGAGTRAIQASGTALTAVALKAPAQTNLSSGTTITLGTDYYDTFGANRTLTISGTTDGSRSQLTAIVTTPITLTVTAAYRNGAAATSTSVPILAAGRYIIQWQYKAGALYQYDNAGGISLLATATPLTTDSLPFASSTGDKKATIADVLALVTSEVSDAAYDSGWNGVTGTAPSKNAVYDAIEALGAGGASAYQTLTDGATITLTAAAGYAQQNAEVTLAGNRTLAFSGIADGMRGLLKVTQDATGSRTLALPANSYVQGNGAGLVTLTTTAGATDFLSWSYDGTNVFWDSPRLNYTTFTPTFSSATIDGTALAVTFTGPVTRGAGYSDAHLDVDLSTTGANIGVTYSSGDGTAVHNYVTASAAVNGETADVDFSGAANSLESAAGNDLAAIVSGAVTNDTASTAPDPDLLWWKMNDGTGATITADVGPGSTTHTGTWTTGASGSGYAIEMLASGDGNYASSSTVAYAAETLTISFWLKVTTNTPSTGILRSGGSGNTPPRWEINNNNGPIKFTLAGTTGTLETQTSSYSTGTWRHFVAVFDNSTSGGTLKVYLNGTDLALSPTTNTKASTGNFATGNLNIKSPFSSVGQFEMDDLRIYSGELTSVEIAAIYAAGAQ